MRQAYRIIPIYTADVSGVCSALYELGGMTVMHDPSGCNSTYNTHDEIRWYDEDSLIFISGLTEIDAIMGNDEKFIHDIEEAASELKPRFIALASSPIPYMNGTDFPAIAEVTEQDMGIPTFAVPTNGMHDYVRGAGMALEAIAEHFVLPKSHAEDVSNKNTEEKGRNRLVNLLGVTPLDFGPLDHAETMKRSLEQYGWQINSMGHGRFFGSAVEICRCSSECGCFICGASGSQSIAEKIRYTLCGWSTGWPFHGEVVRGNGSSCQW